MLLKTIVLMMACGFVSPQVEITTPDAYFESLPLVVHVGETFTGPVKYSEPARYVFKGCVFPRVIGKAGDDTTLDALKVENGSLTVVDCLFLGGKGSKVRCIRGSSKTSGQLFRAEIHGNTFLSMEGVPRKPTGSVNAFDCDYIVFQNYPAVDYVNITNNVFRSQTGKCGRVLKLQRCPNTTFSHNQVDVRWIKSGVVSPQIGSDNCTVTHNYIKTYAHDFVIGGRTTGAMEFSFNRLELTNLVAGKVQNIMEAKVPVTGKVRYRRNDISLSEAGTQIVEIAKGYNISDLTYEH